MSPFSPTLEMRGAPHPARDEIAGWLIGGGFTFALFFALAHFENFGAAAPVVAIEDIRMAGAFLEPPPPPPKIEEHTPTSEAALPLAGLEIAAAESPVSIAIVPPDLESLVPATSDAPRASVQFALLHTDLKPKANIEADVRHVFQSAEVDQRPRALVRTVPPIPPDVRGSASTLRVGLILLIGADGKAESARVAESSGNPRFDAIVARTVQNEWMFSPAIRRGKKVRVLAQQPFRINFNGSGSPLGLD